MKKNTKALVDQILSLDDAELEGALAAVTEAQAERQRAAKDQRKKRPKQLPAAEFNALVKEAKSLVKGRTINSKQKLTVDVERTCVLAWLDDEYPEVVDYFVSAHCPQLGSWVAEAIEDDLQDAPTPAEDKATEKMTKDIKRLLTKIGKLERKHKIDTGALLDAVRAKTADYARW